jgi:L-fucose mutarotase
MLKNVNPLLNGEILKALYDMGHGDELVVVDAHYPVQTAARQSTLGHSLHMEGADTALAIRAILSVFPLDHNFVKHPVERMMVDDKPQELPNVQREAQEQVDAAHGGSLPFGVVPRRDFYERAKKACCVVITGETRGWGCFILRKGLDVTPDMPARGGSAHISTYTVS